MPSKFHPFRVVYCFFCLIIIVEPQRLARTVNGHEYSHEDERKLLHIHEIGEKIRGIYNYVPNVTVYTSVITSTVNKNSHQHNQKTNHVNHSDANAARVNNIQTLKRHFYPFPVTEWPAIYTRPCPNFEHGHKTERGLALAHYQIWLDFVFFDNDVLDALKRNPPEYLPGTPYSSISGRFQAYQNGTLLKNDLPFQENDILIILEDDAESVVEELNSTLVEELSAMSTDIVYLGWCEGRMARPVPLCLHAYALTRAGARKLIKYYEPCGKALDEQFVMFAKNNFISYRRANPWSYKTLRSDYVAYDRKTDGVIRQNKHIIASINGH